MSDGVVQVAYHGSVTVGSPGRSLFHDRDGRLSDFIWNALGEAGWLGQAAQLHPLIELLIEMPPCTGNERDLAPWISVAPGGPRREGERGPMSEDGTIRKGYHGPLHGRAAGPGVRLVESERHDDDFDLFEDMLYQGALEAGWLTADSHEPRAAQIPRIEILIRIPAYQDTATGHA